MEYFYLLTNTFILRPYVFVFLGVSLYSGQKLLGGGGPADFSASRGQLLLFVNMPRPRIGIPFGEYFYTGFTQGQELYLSNIPFMASLSFSFLLFGSYCLALVFVLPSVKQTRQQGWRYDRALPTSWSVVALTVVFFTFLDVIIDPVALQGRQWFLGKIYSYPQEAVYFGVPLENFAGWAVVGFLFLLGYRCLERGSYASDPIPREVVKWELLLGIGLYYGVLAFNLGVTFWIGEMLMGIVGCFI